MPYQYRQINQSLVVGDPFWMQVLQEEQHRRESLAIPTEVEANLLEQQLAKTPRRQQTTPGSRVALYRNYHFSPRHTCVIVMDMWDYHCCRVAGTRLPPLAHGSIPFYPHTEQTHCIFE